jgi:hypothetical protein
MDEKIQFFALLSASPESVMMWCGRNFLFVVGEFLLRVGIFLKKLIKN